MTRVDALGRRVTLARPPRRIISLAPSVTEDLFAIGAGRQVVGDTEYDDYPPAATRLPKVGGFSGPNLERVLALHPDLVIAVRGNPLEFLAQLDRFHVPYFALDPHAVHDVELNLRDLGSLTGHRGGASEVIQQMESSLASARLTISKAPRRHLTGLLEISASPIYLAGPNSFSGDLLTLAGIRNVAPTSPGGYPQVSAETVLRLRPDSYLYTEPDVTPASIAARPGWSAVPAVAHRQVFRVDSNWVSRPTPRVVKALQQIVHDLYGHR